MLAGAMGEPRSAASERSTTIRPAGLEAELWNDSHFSQLRKANGVPDDFVNEGWSYKDLEKGGGKGGTLMVFIEGKYIVKELSKGDHKTLLSVTESYAEHVKSGDSRLCMVFLHYRDLASGRLFFVMRNEVGLGPFEALYDLKGCADDKMIVKNGGKVKAVHKRVWQVHLWCGRCRWSDDRRRYYACKEAARKLELPLPDKVRSELMRQISSDCEWLASNRLMDYSLLVGIRRDEPGIGGERSFHLSGDNGNDSVLCLSIIDFLQLWTCGKRIARGLKFMECNKATVPPRAYARRFVRHFEGCFVPLELATTVGLKAVEEKEAEAPASSVVPTRGQDRRE